MPKVYIIEDNADIRDVVLYALTNAGFKAIGFENGDDFFKAMKKDTKPPALVLLDIMLPYDDGLSILKRLRSSPQTKTLPIIMLTAKSSEFDKVKGLDLGADDYVTKPFGVMELISRVNAVLRRSGTEPEPQEKLEYKSICINDARRTVHVNRKPVTLTYKEYELLHFLVRNCEYVMDRNKIMDAVWGFDYEGESRTLDIHIRTLRQKLGAAGEHIKTVRNVGYKIGE